MPLLILLVAGTCLTSVPLHFSILVTFLHPERDLLPLLLSQQHCLLSYHDTNDVFSWSIISACLHGRVRFRADKSVSDFTSSVAILVNLDSPSFGFVCFIYHVSSCLSVSGAFTVTKIYNLQSHIKKGQ